MLVKIEKNNYHIDFELDDAYNIASLNVVKNGEVQLSSTIDLETAAIIATFALGVRNFTDAVIRVVETGFVARSH